MEIKPPLTSTMRERLRGDAVLIRSETASDSPNGSNTIAPHVREGLMITLAEHGQEAAMIAFDACYPGLHGQYERLFDPNPNRNEL
jgi:hypothetical protein